MAVATPRLSLVAQFDDLTRNRSVLTTGIETEFWQFVVNQDACRKRWLEADGNYADLKERIRQLELENKTLQTKLKHARSSIDHENRKRKRAEAERESLERQILLVRELLTDKNHSVLNDKDREKLAFLSTDFHGSHMNYENSPQRNLDPIEESVSLLSASDISYDKTEEDLEVSYLRSGRKWNRPSAPPMEEDSPSLQYKKSRRSRERRKHRRSKSAVVAKTTVTVEGKQVEAEAEITTDGRKRHLTASPAKPLKKFHSDGNVKDSGESGDEWGASTPSRRVLREVNTPFKTPPESRRSLRHQSSGNALNKPHNFVRKTMLNLNETCDPCSHKMKFGKPVAKCRDCRATVHLECKDKVPLPCVPATVTPGTSRNAPGVIADYVSSDPPMIPALVIHCVNEIESRGLSEVGIFRVPGSEREVRQLKDKFLSGRGVPNLGHVDDIHVVCGTLKDFLRGLKEPLVTYELWHDFVNAAENVDGDESLSSTYQAISRLPQPNRDTIAFLVLHLQRVSESEQCKMPVNNLAKVFGPTIVGYSLPEPEPMQMINETRKQQVVMERLLSISTDYWTRFLNTDDVTFHARDPATPLTPEGGSTLHRDSLHYKEGDPRKSLALGRQSVPHSMLGPIHTDEHTDKKSWFTPRFGSKSRNTSTVNKAPTHFFSSPLLK